ncbi:MAG: right-handed parallel beta-helix repeat-containing protein [Clostridiales bacterium]|nr:right-handed parallel beta-helix repeat-containing protein [Clostridiales bacterium]
MRSFKKKWIGALCALSVIACAVGIGFSYPASPKANAENTESVDLDFTDTMDGAAFKAPANNFGWKVTKGVLTPDNSQADGAQIGYLEQAIALNESKYISLDFYASACPMDIMLLPYAETVNPWVKTGVAVHCMASGWLRLDRYIDANDLHIADYTGIGDGVDGYAHKLEITSDGTNLTFKVDGVDAFTGATVAIPADSVQLVLRAPKDSYIDNLYIASEKPAETATAVDVDFTDKTDLNEFTTMALNGWTGGNGKFQPVDAGAMYNASATKFNTPIDLTGSKYISFDFFSTAATFDVGLLDTSAVNIWGNALFIHMPFGDSNAALGDSKTIGINSYVDCTSGTYYDGVSIDCIDGKAHTLEMLIDGGKVSYVLDGNPLVGNGGTAQFNAPADSAYLVFRAVGTESYIDNLYIADSAPTEIDYDFDSVKSENAFAAWNNAGWGVADGNFVANAAWATTQLKSALDLTKNQEITFDVYLSSADSNKQFNVGFFAEENLANASTVGSGVGFSLGSTLWLGTNLGRQGWIADVAASLYNDTWHSVKIAVAEGQMSIALDGVAYSALTTAIPADTAYLLMQSTSAENALDNFKITIEETVEPEVPVEPPVAEGNLGDTELDFAESSDGDLFAAYGGSVGWSVADGVYKANAVWASVNTVQKLSLTEKKTITFDVYLSSTDADKQFNFGFFATTNADTNAQAGAGVNYSLGATLFHGTSFSRVHWVADVAADLYTDGVHKVQITAEGGFLSIAVDGTEYPTLKAAIPADEVYLLMQATSTETYVDNFVIADDILDELTLKFSSESQAAEYTEAMANGGWVVKSGRYYPAEQGVLFNASAFKVSQAISLADEKYISFDFYSTAATFDVGLLDVAAGNLWGNGLFIHLPYSDGTIGVTTNVDCTAGAYQFGSTANVLDGKVHNLKIAVVDGKVAYYLDGAELSASVANIPAEQVFVVFRSVGEGSYIDNLIISDSDIEYVAPVTYLEELSLDFASADAAANFVELALGGWQVADGKFAPTQNGAMNNASVVRTALPIDLTGTKYISLDFFTTAATFDIGFLDVSAVNMWGNALFFHAPYSDGATIGVDTYIDCGGTYIGGVAQNPMDGKAHNLLMIVNGGKVAFALDGVQLSFTADIPADTVYLVLRAVGADSYIDNLTVSETEPMMDEFSLDFSESVSSKIFATYYNNGWSATDGKYVPYGVDSTVQTFHKMDLTKNWDIRFNVYLTGAFNVGFFAEPTMMDVGDGKSFAFGETLWLGSRFGRNNWLADVGVNLIDNSLHAVRITVLNGNISIAVDGISYNHILKTAVPANAAYLLMQAADTNTYVDDFSVSALTAYTLTVKDIQGNLLSEQSVGGYYILPVLEDSEKGQFIGYYYGGRAYRATNEISVEEDGELIAIFAKLSMVEGASIRLTLPTGMRFTSSLDEDSYKYLTELGIVQIGTLIAKAEDVVDAGDYSKLYYNNEYTHLNIVSTVGAMKNGSYVFNGVLASIKPSHYDWQFAARGYIKVTYFDGYELAFYTNGVSRVVREVAEVAYLDRNDTQVTEGEDRYPYLTEDGDYSPYDEEGRSILQSFLVGNAVYVSTSGNDNYDGSTLAKAVATFERAAELTRDSEDALILLCDGEYTVSQTAVIGSNVTVRSLNRNAATLSGSTVIDNTTVTERNDLALGRVWEIPYGEKINQLYINDSYGIRARYPDAGQELRLFNADETLRTLSVFADDIEAFSASDFEGSVIVPSIQWAESYLRIKSITERTLSNAGTPLSLVDIRLCDEDNVVFARNLAMSPRTSYHFENSYAFLNAQGEWYYDEAVNKIYYLPYDGETLANTTIRIPVTETLVRIAGESGTIVENVTFDGVNFMYTKNGAIDGKIGGQANRNDAFEYANLGGMHNGRPAAALEMEFVDNIIFTENVFACMGGGALDLLQGASNVTIEGNVFRAVGGNGVLVGTLNTDADVMMQAYEADNSVINTIVNTVNNYFTEIGWQEYGSCAVVYTYAANSKINQNTINNVAYTGISLGWGWQHLEAGAYLENNEIVGNRITNVMSFLNDGGAIYLVGCQPNTYVAENYIANVYNGVYKYPVDLRDNAQTDQYWWANAGIYLDTSAGSNEESTMLVVENNYIADDIENQKYEFCNVVNVPDDAVYAKYYFTIDGVTGDALSINMSNGVTANDVSGAGASAISQLAGKTILFGAHMLDENTLTVYGVGFGASYDGSLTVNGQQVSSSDIASWTDGAITFTTSGYAGCSATVQVGDSNRLYTAMNVNVAEELARFDGYIDVNNIATWYTALDVKKQTINSVEVSSGEESADCAMDGLYYTAWESSEEDNVASITFYLKTASTVETFLMYDIIATDEPEAEYRENIRIVGLTSFGEVVLFESEGAQAYTNFGMLELDMEALGKENAVFTGFRIEKMDGGALAVAEIAVV